MTSNTLVHPRGRRTSLDYSLSALTVIASCLLTQLMFWVHVLPFCLSCSILVLLSSLYSLMSCPKSLFEIPRLFPLKSLQSLGVEVRRIMCPKNHGRGNCPLTPWLLFFSRTRMKTVCNIIKHDLKSHRRSRNKWSDAIMKSLRRRTHKNIMLQSPSSDHSHFLWRSGLSMKDEGEYSDFRDAMIATFMSTTQWYQRRNSRQNGHWKKHILSGNVTLICIPFCPIVFPSQEWLENKTLRDLRLHVTCELHILCRFCTLLEREEMFTKLASQRFIRIACHDSYMYFFISCHVSLQ